MMKKIGIVDTAFSRVDMAKFAIQQIEQAKQICNSELTWLKATVPGHKEVAVEALRLLEQEQCDICIVFGWVGPKALDLTSAHEAAIALAMAKVQARKHVLECFIFESQHEQDALFEAASQRAVAHAKSAISMITDDPAWVVHSSIGDREGEANASVLEAIS
ncbi:riboflavin synthase [Zooshikella sp. RANM57]|uniref:riboflavin synthase n=1 Tax=Zooshikella sp. RANM57 TaxID=3425863 RepID=UPI003D6DBA83